MKYVANIKIGLKEDGQLEVLGDIDDFVVAQAMIEGALDAIKTHCAQDKKVVIPAAFTQKRVLNG